jgi:hypothetical protein
MPSHRSTDAAQDADSQALGLVVDDVGVTQR